MLQQTMMWYVQSAAASAPVPELGLLVDLITYYKLDSNADDAHGSNDGSVSNVTWDTSNQKLGTAAADMNWTSSYINANNSITEMWVTNEFSISTWVKPDSNSGLMTIFWNRFATTREFLLYHTNASTGLRALIVNSNSETIDSWYGSVLSTWTWYHIVLTWKKWWNFTLYVNGVQDLQVSGGAYDVRTSSDNFLIGREVNNDREFDWLIDWFGVWERELSSANVSSLYNSGSWLSYDSFTS